MIFEHPVLKSYKGEFPMSTRFFVCSMFFGTIWLKSKKTSQNKVECNIFNKIILKNKLYHVEISHSDTEKILNSAIIFTYHQRMASA